MDNNGERERERERDLKRKSKIMSELIKCDSMLQTMIVIRNHRSQPKLKLSLFILSITIIIYNVVNITIKQIRVHN